MYADDETKLPEDAQANTEVTEWTKELLESFCEQNDIDYEEGATKEELIDTIEANGYEVPTGDPEEYGIEVEDEGTPAEDDDTE